MISHLICLPDGTELFSGAGTANAIQSVALTECVNNGEELILGSVCANMLEAALLTPQGGLSLTAGDEVVLYKVDDGGERRRAGVYILEKPTRPTANTMKITGYDRIIKLDKDLTVWLQSLNGWPYRLIDFAEMVCAACGLSLAAVKIPNEDFSVPKFQCAEVTGRQLMKWIGEISCRFCRADADGNIELAWYTPAGVSIAPSGDHYYFQNGLTYEDYEVASVEAVQLKLADSSSGALWPTCDENTNAYVIAGNPILLANVSHALDPYLQVICNELAGIAYTPCKVTIPASREINAGNTVQITDSNGVKITACVMTKTTNGQKDTLECTGSARRDSPTAKNNNSSADRVNELLLAVKNIDGDKVVSMINLTESDIKIQASKIRLEGLVTANENFQILNDGSIAAVNGTISGKIIATEGEIGKCMISQDGYLQITNANIAEKLTGSQIDVDTLTVKRVFVEDTYGNTLLSVGDNSVQIAGWNVDDNSLYSTYADSASRVFMCTGTRSAYTIGGYTDRWYFGAGSSSGNGFGVSTSGVLCASGAKISGEIHATTGCVGGWKIGQYRMYSDNGSYINTNGTFQFYRNVFNYLTFDECEGDNNQYELLLGSNVRLRIGSTALTEADLIRLLDLI